MAAEERPLLVWVDAQLPPALAQWLETSKEIRAVHVEALGLLQAEDAEIFASARAAGVVVVTKDQDFVQLQERRGTPPQIVWVTCGNCSNRELKALLADTWSRTIELLKAGEPLVEIKEKRSETG